MRGVVGLPAVSIFNECDTNSSSKGPSESLGNPRDRRTSYQYHGPNIREVCISPALAPRKPLTIAVLDGAHDRGESQEDQLLMHPHRLFRRIDRKREFPAAPAPSKGYAGCQLLRKLPRLQGRVRSEAQVAPPHGRNGLTTGLRSCSGKPLLRWTRLACPFASNSSR